MPIVITLRACLMAAGAVLSLVLAGCAGPATESAAVLGGVDQGAEPTGRAGHSQDDAADVLPDVADLNAQLLAARSTSATTVTLTAPAPAPETVQAAPSTVTVEAPAPVVQQSAPAAQQPTEPTCAAGEEYDPTIPACVAQQLPDESLGGARCPDPADVVVAIAEDGSLVCGPADDTTAGA